MLKSTRTAVEAVLRADPSVTTDQIREAVRVLDGKTAAGLVNTEPLDRALSRKEVAEILGCSVRTVTDYAQRGLIRRFTFGVNGKLAHGYSADSVRALMAGHAGKEARR
ncbi:MAG: helix-turn-helix domain-containing protein [Kiritimatiellae bacterium]|nr:helix-turn-helix domain-containing protein [Kiritimatiellia bacterium]